MTLGCFLLHRKMKPWVPVLILLFLSSFCRSDDQLTPAKPLSPGDTIVSKAGHFALGFFSPKGSNVSLYLGIWYHSIPGRTVVWTANRDDPIAATSSPTLAIANSSDLVLTDSQGRTPWATKNNITSSGAAAVLLDTGNLVLRLSNGTIIWQSFDHPTDTILPGMTILLSEKARVVGRVEAWKSPNDPSTGDFSLSLDSGLSLIIWRGTRPYCRIAMLNGGGLVEGDIYQNTIFYEAIVGTGDGLYYKFTVSDGSPYARLMLDHLGVLRTLSWNNRSSWTTVSERPASSYDLYALCGMFGYSDSTGAVPTCRCLDGFEPAGLNFSNGCKRTKAFKCGDRSHFLTLQRMKVPDKFLHVLNRSFDECTTECSSNCSCTAYTYTNWSSNAAMADQSRCLLWTGELVDMEKYSNNGENLYIRLAYSPVRKNSKLVKIVLPTMACVLILACIALARICKYKASKRQKKEIHKEPML